MKQRIPNKANAVAELTAGEPAEARKRVPIKLLVIAFIFTGGALIWLSWSTYDLYARHTVIEAKVGRARELGGTIIHLDEVLTMAARMAAATGDPQWEARYRRFEPQLNQVIEEISKLTPSQMLDQTNAANLRLVEMENHVFSLVRENHLQEAHDLLLSQEYEQQKEKYALGMFSFIEQLHVQLEAKQQRERSRAVFSAIAGSVVLTLLLFTWLAIIRRMYRAHAILLSNITRRKQTEEVLRKAQRDLEVRVQERTAELTLANTSLEGQIIERASAEDALRRSEELHRDLFENANDIIYTADLAGNYTSVNKACEKMVGYTRAEALTMNITQVIAPEYLEQTRAMLGRQNDENSTAYELEIIAKNGHRVTLEVKSRLTYCDGKPSGVQGMARNITDRKRAEAERQAITEIVQGVLTTSNLDELFSLAHQTISHCLPAQNCFIALYDKATDLLHIPFFKDQFDPTPAPQKVGRGLTAFVLRSGRPMLLRPELIQELALTGEIELFGTLPAAWLGVPLRTSTDIIGLLVVQHYEDKDAYNEQDLELLTSVADQLGLAIERKQIEVELKTNEMQLTAAQQIAHIGNWEWDVIKKNLRWSEELFRIFGFPPRDSGPTVAEFFAHVHPESVKLVKSAIKEALRHGVISGFIFRIVRPDQTVRVLQMNGEVGADENGRSTRLWGTIQDITERDRAETERDVISEVIQSVNLTSNIDELLAQVHQSLKKVLYAENCCVALFDKQDGLFEAPLFVDLVEANPFPVALSKNCIAKVFSSGQPLLMNQAIFAGLLARGEVELVGSAAPSFLAVPLMTPAETVGVIVVQHYEKENVYSQRDVEFLSAVAAQLALAIERKRAEQALIESDRRFRDLFYDAPVGYHEIDTEGRITCVNTTELLMLGYSSAEMIGHHVWEFIEEAEIARATFAEKLGGTKPLRSVERSFRRKDGTLLEVQLDDQMLHDPSGRIIGIRATMQDIGERKRAEMERQVIAEIVQSVITTTNLDELFKLAHQEINKILPAESCFIALHNLDTDVMHCDYWVDQFDAAPLPRPLGKGFSSYMLRTGQPLLLTKELKEQMYERGEVQKSGTDSLSWLGVPLRTRSRTIGVLVVQDYEQEHAYNQRDIEFLSAVGDQLGLAIERKQIELELKANEMKLTEAQQIANLGSWEWDVQANKMSWSEELYRIYGLQPQEFDVSYAASLTRVHPDDRKLVQSTIEQTLHHKVHPNLVYRIIRPDGTVRTLQANGRVTVDETGRTVKLVGTVVDITERMHVENALRQSEDKYRELIENANDIIYTIDLSGGFTSMNRAGERMTGYTREEALHMNIANVIKPEDVDRVRQRIAKNLAGAGAPDFELEIFAKDGSSVTMDISSRLILQDGVVVGIQGIGRDITERKQVDEKLRDSEEKYRSLLENIPDVTWTTDDKGNTVFISANVESVYGFTSDELVNDEKQRWLERIHPDDMERVLAGYHSLFADRKPYDVEFRIQRKDGVWIWLNDRARRPYEKGGVLYADGVFSDITERKRIDEELKTNETRMSEAQRIAHLGSWEYDVVTGAVKWSSELWRIFGLDQREFGLTFEECLALVHPDDRDRVRRISEESQQSKKDFGYDYRIIQPDGTVRVFRANGRIICDEQGQILKIKGTDQDITEQKRIEEDLTNSELQLIEAQHMALIGNWEWDIATNKTSWSAALYSIYGIEPEDLVPSFEGYLSLVHPDDRERVAGDVTNVLSELQGCVYQHRIIRPDKSVRHHHVNVKVTVGDDGKPIKLFGTAQDITDRVSLENELKEARDVALESARLKSEFLANMSHEIRTPMNGVIGMTGLLLDSDLDTEQTEFAETIRTSGEALLTIINDILDFSKIEAGKLQFEMLDFDLSNVVEDTLELLAGRAPAKHIEMASLIYSDVPHLLRGDPGRLRQVLTNLIGNALKFTERGEVVVRAEKDLETESDIVIRFTVTDTGIGISEAAQKTLFLAFTQADGSTTRKYGGTGLGLAISKQLVELMGGAIGVSSTEGKGSTFWFTAKFDKQLTQVDSIRTGVLSLDRLRALIVDDNATNRKILSHQLDSWGMVHEEADSGVRALEILRSAAAEGKPYDLAILDFMMPVMDGFELARTIKSDASIAALRMVLLTSFGQRGDGAVARKAGIAAYLTKPVRQSQLFDCLANVMSQASGRPAPAVPGSALVTKHTLAEASVSSNKLILVAEDNVVNQKVAVRQLQKLGYRADTVADGREALEALGRISYDLVLMDCQMPQMDGYEATAEIRLREGTAKHTPIVAMTAHALEGDRAKCIAAGMDEYIAKPVSREELQRVLELFFKDQEAEPLDETRESGESLVDVERMHEMMGDEAHEFSEILDLYLDETAKSLNKLDAALALGDHVEVESIAHNCAGTSANCGMTAVAIPFRELEAAGRTDRLKTAPAALAQAHKVFAQTRDFLAQHCAETVRPPSLNL